MGDDAEPVTDPVVAAELAEFPEMNPGPVCRLSRDGVVRLANGAARRLFGQAGLRGRRWDELCPVPGAAAWSHLLDSQTPVSYEAEIDGRWVMFTFVRSAAGQSVFTFGTDITERRQAELQVANMARFPDINPGPVLRLKRNGTAVLANTAARQVFGGDLLGRCWLDICPNIDGPMWDRILDASEPVSLEARIGEREYVFTHRRDRAADLVFVFGTDITLQKRAERALRQSEKMATLGTLAAGVAHELNNPAAATRRAADELRQVLSRYEQARIGLSELAIGDDGRTALRSLEAQGREQAEHPGDLEALTRSDREAELEAWLDDRGIPDAWDLAPLLVAMGLELPQLSNLACVLDGPQLATALNWVGAAFQVQVLLHEIWQGSARLSEIVGALKSYCYLGEAPVQFVDLHEGLNNTLIILRNKLKAGITVRRDYGSDVPKVLAHGGELNQVWTNLIDNAVDAMGGSGVLSIRTRAGNGDVTVEIEDNGPGIPVEIQPQVFDPFFTTKEPGKGTGLGLSTTYTIVTERHQGRISVTSAPGSTCFKVTLPVDRGSR